MYRNYREETRGIWGCELGNNESLNREQLKLGCLLRIADALERMAEPYVRLLNERDGLVDTRNYLKEKNNRLKRSNAALRGCLKKAKN